MAYLVTVKDVNDLEIQNSICKDDDELAYFLLHLDKTLLVVNINVIKNLRENYKDLLIQDKNLEKGDQK